MANTFQLKILYKAISLILIAPIISACTPSNMKNTNNNNNTEPSPKSFLLANYLIDPENKTVSNRVYFEEDIGHGKNRIHAWGDRYVVDTLIDFNTTCLYITDNQVAFSEYYNADRELPVNNTITPYDVEGYKYVNGFYEKDEQYFSLISITPYKFNELNVPEGVNFGKLTAAPKVKSSNDQYYYDDNGLYFLDNHYKQQIVKVASAKNCVPLITPYYCEYNGVAYQKTQHIAKTSQLKIIDMKLDGKYICITDGKTIFDTGYIERRELSGVDKWVQLTTGEQILIADNCVYLSPLVTINVNADGITYSNDILFASPDGFFSIDECLRNEPRKYNKVYIFNSDKGDNEEVSIAEYTLCIQGYYIYHNKGYFNGLPIANNFDMPNLKQLGQGWLSDGKYLTHENCLKKNSGEGVRVEAVFEQPVAVADINRLQFVTKDLLVDGINFYKLDGATIKHTSIKGLGIKLEINLSSFAYVFNK